MPREEEHLAQQPQQELQLRTGIGQVAYFPQLPRSVKIGRFAPGSHDVSHGRVIAVSEMRAWDIVEGGDMTSGTAKDTCIREISLDCDKATDMKPLRSCPQVASKFRYNSRIQRSILCRRLTPSLVSGK